MANKVRIKALTVEMDVKTNGVEFEVRNAANTSQVGDCYVTKVGLVWCKGRTTKPNGVKISWDELATLLQSQATKQAALKAAKATP